MIVFLVIVLGAASILYGLFDQRVIPWWTVMFWLSGALFLGGLWEKRVERNEARNYHPSSFPWSDTGEDEERDNEE